MFTTYQLVQDFFHHLSSTKKTRFENPPWIWNSGHGPPSRRYTAGFIGSYQTWDPKPARHKERPNRNRDMTWYYHTFPGKLICRKTLFNPSASGTAPQREWHMHGASPRDPILRWLRWLSCWGWFGRKFGYRNFRTCMLNWLSSYFLAFLMHFFHWTHL